jgi:hypothetical protein
MARVVVVARAVVVAVTTAVAMAVAVAVAVTTVVCGGGNCDDCSDNCGCVGGGKG